MPDETTLGVWIPKGSDLPERFDDQLADGAGYSRSAEILEAMELLITVDRTLEELDYEFDSDASRRHFVRQAILEQARRESDE